MTDLDKLIDIIEHGEFSATYGMALHGPCSLWAMEAFDGKLNAAYALHLELIPEWEWNVSWVGAMVGGPDAELSKVNDIEIYCDNSQVPARAWLLAILKAYRSQQ